MVNAVKLLDAYDAVDSFISQHSLETGEFKKIKVMFEDKKREPDARIMVYGIYNAGKSTLINALVGKEVADTDDVPLTDKVSAYKWKQYSILDTPGVDAPIKHENTTKEQMLKSDVVIFVVNPSGAAEEAKTFSVLLDLVYERRQQVFLLFNEKNSLSEEDFIKLKDQTRERLQNLAAQRGMIDVLKDIPILKVNAKRALQGKLKGQEKLIEASGYFVLESALLTFLQSISIEVVYGRLKSELSDFIAHYIKQLQARSSGEVAKKYDNLLQQIELQKTDSRRKIHQDIKLNSQAIYERSKSLMRNSPETCQGQIEKLFYEKGQNVSDVLVQELQFFVNKVQSDIENLQASLPKVNVEYSKVSVPNLNGENVDVSVNMSSDSMSKISPEMMGKAVKQLASIASAEHIVGGLQLVKDYIPSLMKGIGPKTMEKMAGQVIGKWIPLVGTAITVITALWDIFSGDSEAEQMQRQIEENNRQRERAFQQIEDIATELSFQFESSMLDLIGKSLDEFFSQVSLQVDNLRQGFSNEDKANSELIEKFIVLEQLVLTA